MNLIRETASRGILKSVDESHLYCISCGCNNQFNLELFDWNLNRLKTNATFQNEDPKRSFWTNENAFRNNKQELKRKIETEKRLN